MYTLSEKATEDLEGILDYSYLNFGVKVMQEYYDSLENCLNILSNNPELGLATDYLSVDYYRFNHRSHTIFYKKSELEIFIIRLLHKSMDVDGQFGDIDS